MQICIEENLGKHCQSIKTQILEMLNSEKEEDYKSLSFINQILPNLSVFGLTYVDEKFNEFRRAIITKQDEKDLIWKDILKFSIQLQEEKEIFAFMEQNNVTYTQQVKEEMKNKKIDFKSVQAFHEMFLSDPKFRFTTFIN